MSFKETTRSTRSGELNMSPESLSSPQSEMRRKIGAFGAKLLHIWRYCVRLSRFESLTNSEALSNSPSLQQG
jgi:hypothetical protein